MIHLHIGVHKTGTTSIQSTLRNRCQDLHAEGLSIIPTDYALYREFVASANWNSALDFTKHIRNHIDHSTCDDHVLSWEGFSGDPYSGYANCESIAKKLVNALSGCDVKVLIFIRRQDNFIESLYRQSVHEGGTSPIKEFLANVKYQSFDWNKLADIYARLFGPDRVSIHNYDSIVMDGPHALINSFGRIIGSNTLIQDTTGTSANRGYNSHALSLALICNGLLAESERKLLRHALQEYSLQVPSSASILPANIRDDIVSHFAESNRRLFQNYLPGDNYEAFITVDNPDTNEEPHLGYSNAAAVIALIFKHIAQSQPNDTRLLTALERFLKKLRKIKHGR